MTTETFTDDEIESLFGGAPETIRLSAKQALYVGAYMALGNKADAAEVAGYANHRQPDSPKIAEAIAVQQQKTAIRLGLTPDKVVEEYAKIAFFDPRKLVTDAGQPIPLHKLEADVAAAVASVDIQTLGKEKDWAEVVKYKAADKLGALNALGKHLGLFAADNKQKTDLVIETKMSPNETARRVAFLLEGALRAKRSNTAGSQAPTAET